MSTVADAPAQEEKKTKRVHRKLADTSKEVVKKIYDSKEEAETALATLAFEDGKPNDGVFSTFLVKRKETGDVKAVLAKSTDKAANVFLRAKGYAVLPTVVGTKGRKRTLNEMDVTFILTLLGQAPEYKEKIGTMMPNYVPYLNMTREEFLKHVPDKVKESDKFALITQNL